jgi:hypothetical protein
MSMNEQVPKDHSLDSSLSLMREGYLRYESRLPTLGEPK